MEIFVKNMLITIIRIALVLFTSGIVHAEPPNTTKHIIVDQFGYRPGDKKIAVLANPQQGFNAGASYMPGSVLEVREWESDEIIFSGAPQIWNSGATHTQSGDRGWWFDFSTVKREGTYYLYDTERALGSYQFEIREDIYFDVLKTALKMYYYNRCTIAKVEPYADRRWIDGPSFSDQRQDGQARFVEDKDNASLTRDMSGGWFDAGDFNKYVTFAEDVIHQLLDAYSQNPGIWTDNFNIPESGNGIPDIIDEIKWELDWVKRMQDMEDGGVHIKIGSITYTTGSPPSTDKNLRYYGPKCSSSSIAAAGMFAHAALVFRELSSLKAYADDLETRAVLACQWYRSHLKRDDCDTQEIKSGDADRSIEDQKQMAVTAAVYLFALTEDGEYGTYVIMNYNDVENLGWWGPYRMSRGDALLYYTQLPMANTTAKQDILNRKLSNANSLTDFYKQFDNKDLYRANMPDAQYHWGSNSVKSNVGLINYDMITYALDAGNRTLYLDKALSSIHYIHGINPLSMVYLSNMYDYGAENSANSIYHGWFNHGTIYEHALTSPNGPAPGYIPGGANKSYSGNTAGISNQPPQKAYKDGNGYVNSWEVTEPGIYYQSAYIKLLSKFIDADAIDDPDGPQNPGKVPSVIELNQNYPNPFNPGTTINFAVKKTSKVKIGIYNNLGELIIILVDGEYAADEYSITWMAVNRQGKRVPSGIYFCRALATPLSGENGEEVESRKLIVIR
jgi:endoglucanase